MTRWNETGSGGYGFVCFVDVSLSVICRGFANFAVSMDVERFTSDVFDEDIFDLTYI